MYLSVFPRFFCSEIIWCNYSKSFLVDTTFALYFYEKKNRTLLSLSFYKYFSILILGGDVLETIGYRIKKLRNCVGITLKDLSEKLGISDKTLSRYEKDVFKPDAYALVRIATFFGVSSDYLLCIGGLKPKMLENEIINDRKDLYKRYIECRENYSVDEDALYYWIYSESYGQKKGGQTEFVGFTDTEPRKEIRKLRYVNPAESIKLCTEVYGKPMVLNDKDDIGIFLIFGGHAIIRADICESSMPYMLKPYYG